MIIYRTKRDAKKRLKNIFLILRVYCKKIVPFVHYYREQLSSYNHTAHNILMNEISLNLPNLLLCNEGCTYVSQLSRG